MYFSLLGERSIFSEKAIFSRPKPLPKKHHRFYDLHGLSDAHSLGPHCAFFRESPPTFLLRYYGLLYLKETRQPAQGSLLTETVLVPGSGHSWKCPGSTERKSPGTPYLSWRKWKLQFAGVRLPASNPYVLGPSLFRGLGPWLVQLQTTSTNHEYTRLHPGTLPPPRPSACSPALCSTSSYGGLCGRSRGARVVLIIYTDRRFFSSETQFLGSSSFEVSHFDFSPAASSKLTTKSWHRRTEIGDELSSNSLRAQPSRQSKSPSRHI